MRPRRRGKGLRLELGIDPGMPDALVIDDGRTRQILANLIDNAIKFTHQGQVRVRAAGLAQGRGRGSRGPDPVGGGTPA